MKMNGHNENVSHLSHDEKGVPLMECAYQMMIRNNGTNNRFCTRFSQQKNG